MYFSKAQWKTNVHPDTSWTSFSFAGEYGRVTGPERDARGPVRVLPDQDGVTPQLRGNTAVFSPGSAPAVGHGNR